MKNGQSKWFGIVGKKSDPDKPFAGELMLSSAGYSLDDMIGPPPAAAAAPPVS